MNSFFIYHMEIFRSMECPQFNLFVKNSYDTLKEEGMKVLTCSDGVGSILICFVLVFVVSCDGALSDKAKEIDMFVHLCHDYKIFDGTVLVPEHGNVIYKKSYGQANKEWDVPNGLGFQFLLDKNRDMGLAVLEFNAEEYSSSPWVYESLAEAYVMTGDKEKAIENLKRLLEIDPNNVYASKKLEERIKKK